MNIPGNKRVQLADLPLIDADVGTVVWVENLGVKYEAVPRSAKSTGAVDGPADALTPISWQPSGVLVTTTGGTFAASGIQVEGSVGTVTNGVLTIDLDNSLPGYPALMALQPRRLIMPCRRSGRTHLIDTGTKIKQISDLSGYGLHQQQATSTRMPPLGLGGLDPGPSFVYASQSYTFGTSPVGAGGQTQWTRCYAFYSTSTSTLGDTTGSSKAFYVGACSGSSDVYQIGSCPRTFPSISTNAVHLLVLVFDASQSTDALKCQVYLDGSDTPLVTSPYSGSMPASLPAAAVDSFGWNYQTSNSQLNGVMLGQADFAFAASGATLTALHTAWLAALESI